MKATRATLILCATGLRDQGRNFFLSELVFRILQDKMNPVDLKLLKDWARIKGEDKREKSMLEHVHSEYPVNVKFHSLSKVNILSHAAQEWTKLTLEDEATHSDRIIDIPLPLQHIDQVSHGQIVSSIGIFRKDFFELRRDEPSFGIVRAALAAVSRSMHIEHRTDGRKDPEAILNTWDTKS
ncbi:unnamed protein product [Alternaria alternata]